MSKRQWKKLRLKVEVLELQEKVLVNKNNTKLQDHSSAKLTKGSTHRSVPDTGNLPNLKSLRQNALTQQSLENRILELRQLNHTSMPSKLKSQRRHSVEKIL